VFSNPKYAMMYRCVMREHCEITPDSSIPETLPRLHLNPNITILTMKTYHFPMTNYNTSSDLCLKKVFADQSETQVNLFEVIGF
jgi:hypothetical protein